MNLSHWRRLLSKHAPSRHEEDVAVLKSVRALSGAVALILLAAILTGCQTSSAMGTPREVNGGTQIVVPAMWASAKTGKGGIEPASVWVDTDRTSQQLTYNINLSDVEAKGGGTMWRAATSSAAAIGTLLSGRDPDNVALSFDITGPIDGPSAGAILTVGVLAAFNKHTLDPMMTMTGTISPDGSVGPVGLIALKIKYAAESGLKKILIPALLTSVSDPESRERVDTQVYAKKFGVEVIYVKTIAEAYKLFTGKSIASDNSPQQYQLSRYPALELAQQRSLTGFLADLTDLAGSPSDVPAAITRQVENAAQAANAGKPESAFGLAVDALDQYGQWLGATEFNKDLARSNLSAASSSLLSRTRAEVEVISHRIETVADSAIQAPLHQQLALSGVLGWLTYSRAVLESLTTAIESAKGAMPASTLVEYSGLAQQMSLEAAVLFPRILEVHTAVPSLGRNADKNVNEFLAGYTTFLKTAGDANLTYVREVTGVDAANLAAASVFDLVPVASALGTTASSINLSVESLDTEVEQLSAVMTYFVVTTSLVASAQVFGSAEMWLNATMLSDSDAAYIEGSIDQSRELVDKTADVLVVEKIHAGFPLWSAQWGAAAYQALVAQDRASSGAAISFNELWYDVITVLSMRAYATPE